MAEVLDKQLERSSADSDARARCSEVKMGLKREEHELKWQQFEFQKEELASKLAMDTEDRQPRAALDELEQLAKGPLQSWLYCAAS